MLNILGIAIALIATVASSCKPMEDEQQNQSRTKSSQQEENSGSIQTEGKDGVDTDNTRSGEVSLQGGNLDVEFVNTGSLALGDAGASLALDRFGSAIGSDVQAISYFIGNITLCNHLDINGSGFSGARDCMTIYSNEQADESVPRFPSQAADAEFQQGITAMYEYAMNPANASKFINLADPEDVKKLSKSVQLTSRDIREYKYGVINWMPAVKIRAKVTIPANANDPTTYPAKTICTKASAPLFEKIGADHYRKIFHPVNNLDCPSSGQPEDAVLVTGSGGTWFSFGSPLVVTEQDILEKKSFKLTLTIDPDGLIRVASNDGWLREYPHAVANRATWNPSHGQNYSQGWGIEIPLISPVPVVHRADQTLTKEKYLVHFNVPAWGSDWWNNVDRIFDVRVQLYHLTDDPTKAVQGVETQLLPVAQTVSSPGQMYGPRKIKQLPNGDILMCTIFSEAGQTVQNYDCVSNPVANTSKPSGNMIPYFEGFRRLETLNTPANLKFRESSSTFNVSGHCRSGSDSTGYCENMLDVTYELVERVVIE